MTHIKSILIAAVLFAAAVMAREPEAAPDPQAVAKQIATELRRAANRIDDATKTDDPIGSVLDLDAECHAAFAELLSALSQAEPERQAAIDAKGRKARPANTNIKANVPTVKKSK